METKEILKEIYNIFESIGKVNKLDEFTNQLTELTINNKFGFILHKGNYDFKDLPINSIVIKTNNDLNKTTARINLNPFIDDIGDVKYNLNIELWFNHNNPDKETIRFIFSHELHHFWDDYIRFNKETKTKNLVKVKNLLNFEYRFIENPIIKNFLRLFYLSLDEEINARVQEFHYQLKNKTKEEVIEFTKQSQIYEDSFYLMNYNINQLDELSDEEKEKFLISFNSGFKITKMNFNFKDFNELKKYIDKKFKEKGEKLHKKILKVAGYSVGLKEGDLIFYVDEFLDERIVMNESPYIYFNTL